MSIQASKPNGAPASPLPHSRQIVRAGRPIASAVGALILVHGRGASAESILPLAPLVGANDLALLAPQATGNSWYPYGFMTPIERNEPGISSGIALLEQLVLELEAAGIPSTRTALLGFSQGACLTLEFAARHARRYGALIGLSGGLIGPDGTPRNYAGSLGGTPVLLGCSDVDSHIPEARVRETAATLEALGGAVDLRIYPGMAHTVNDDELAAAKALIAPLASQR